MIGLLRAAVLAFVLLSVVYVIVSIYSRSVRREKLEKRFDEGDVGGDRDAYIAQGMTKYEKGLRKRLIWLVYIIPITVVGVLIYLVNYA